jgi:hypothetical protein
VDPVTDPLLLRKSGSDGNRAQTSGSVARNPDHWTTEAVTTDLSDIITYLCEIRGSGDGDYGM